MRKCPSCNEKTIATKWLLINKSNDEIKYCIECPNCNTKVRKHKNIVLDLITADIVSLSILTFIFAVLIRNYVPSFTYGLILFILLFTALHFYTEYFAKLKVAEEYYCLTGWSRKGAIFVFIGMGLIVCMTIYCLVIQPSILNEPPCN
jgi:hypothetical protein